MSIPLTGTAGWFTRQGAIVGEYNRSSAMYGSALDAGFQTIWAQFGSSDQAAVAGLPAGVATFRGSNSSYASLLVSSGQSASLLQAQDDTVVVPATFAQSINVLYDQMVGTSASINRPTITTTVTPGGTNLGDATIAVGTTNQYGDQLDMILAETVTAVVTTDSPAYGETFTFTGQPTIAANSPFYPGGSGATKTYSAFDPTGTGIVTDGGFESWTGTGNNTPVSWTIVNGAAGVTVFRGTGGVRGTYDAVLTSDGSQTTKLSQSITVSANTVYCVTVQAKVSASDGTGIFVMQLTDGSGTVLVDDAGNNLTYTRNMSAQVSTSFQCFTAFFATPRQLPTTVQVRYGFGTAPAAAKSLYLDLAAVVAAVPLYAGGPNVSVFSGANRNAAGDYYTVTTTNSLGNKSFARGLDRLYSFRQNGIYLPSSNSPTIPDSLVTN